MSAGQIRVPYFRPSIGAEEIAQVTQVLESGWLTGGPKVKELEAQFAHHLQGKKATLAVSSATHGMQLIAKALDLTGLVAVSDMTFSSPAMMCHLNGARIVPIDCDPITLNVEAVQVEKLKLLEAKLGEKLQAIVVTHYGGRAANLSSLADQFPDAYLIEDAAHAFPATYRGLPVGAGPYSIAAFYSFYANKTITSAEGGMIAVSQSTLYEQLVQLRSHGFQYENPDRYLPSAKTWEYDVAHPGYKANMSDVHAAIGLAQLKKANMLWTERRALAAQYTERLKDVVLCPPGDDPQSESAWHVYSVQTDLPKNLVIPAMKERGVQCSSHFKPLSLHTFWRDHFKYALSCSGPLDSHEVYTHQVSLPIYPGMTEDDVNFVCDALEEVAGGVR